MSSLVPFFHLKQRSYKLVQLRGIIVKTDKDKYQNQVATQVRKLKANLQPKGFIDQNNRWTSAIGCPDLTQPHHTTRSNGPSTKDLMAIFLNHLVEEVLALWSAEFCQKVLPGLAEDRKPDIILIDADLPEDWHNLTTIGKMKKSGVDVKNPLWFDEGAKWANAIYASQDSHTFAQVLQFLGDQFTFVFFDHGRSVCLDVLGIQEDSEGYFRLVLYLSLAHHSLVGFDPTIIHDMPSDRRFIQTKHFWKAPIDMVLFISNNLNGCGTVIRQVTLSKDQINQALKNGPNSKALQKWLKGMANMESIVVKDTWLDLATPHTEGMGLVLVPPAFVHPALALKYKEAQALPWQSTVHNQLFWNVPTLTLARHSLTSSLKAHDAEHDQGLELMIGKFTRSVFLLNTSYTLCIMDCIRAHGQAYSPYRILDDGSESNELFPLSFMQADTSLWNLGLVDPDKSDWGPINNSNIRRGLLFDHAFASWAPQDIFSRRPLQPKIFEDNALPSFPQISQDAALPHTTPTSLTPSPLPLLTHVLPAGAAIQAHQKWGIDSVAIPEPCTSKKRTLPEVAKVQVEDKEFVQIKVLAWGASDVNEDLQNFANGDENGYTSIDGGELNACSQTRRSACSPLPGRDAPEESDHYLGIWLENATDEVAIWREVARKECFFCNHDGFHLLKGWLGREWSCEPIKTMLRDMRDLLVYEKAVMHAGMIRIIQSC
ncbi:hypothetical protein EV702DRAFT_1041982 [Suillus placidus]|uniref:Fungal-type protein kinase domain-containing protein n=1 Tax=Suillus placidus TaxID=48579 RepID=A0A9P7A3L4_9AGAM|nr:hypothetical protein EV702DRAFT_1041982 [Suillus placidus]